VTKSFIGGCVFIVGLGVSASSSLGAGVYVGHVTLQNSYGTTPGGEFRATKQADWTGGTPERTGTGFEGGAAAAAGLWETFCLEKSENISYGTSYKAYINTETQSSSSAYAGGAHGGYNDPLDARTAYLYTHFITMSLSSGYDYVNAGTRASNANALQMAIWFIEGEDSTALSGKALQYYNEANNAVIGGAWAGLGDVRVMNLTTDAGANAQDQLIMLPPTVVIPLPGGAAMAGVTLLIAGSRMRRRA
jgi:hypothetical protein